MSIASVGRPGAIGGPFRSVQLGFPSAGGENDSSPPGVSELKMTCKNARLINEMCQALHLEEGGVFRDEGSGAKRLIDHHHSTDGAFLLPE